MTADRYASIEARVRERAYHLWLEEGRPQGRDNEHWRRAERELIEQETGLREAFPAALTAYGVEACGAPEASAEGTASRRSEHKQGPAVAASRSRAKSRAADQSATKPAANAATGSGSRAKRRPATAKPAE